MAEHWTVTMGRIAEAEGWCLSERDDGTWQIQKSDAVDRFMTDDEAVAYVTLRARQNGIVHQKALRLDGQRVKS